MEGATTSWLADARPFAVHCVQAGDQLPAAAGPGADGEAPQSQVRAGPPVWTRLIACLMLCMQGREST